LSDPANHPWQATDRGLRLFLRVTPRAGRDGIDGIGTLSDGRLVLLARVRAIADKGQANAAVSALVAKLLKVPKSSVTLESGATARQKTLHVDGDAQALAACLTDITRAK
jgi:uncharacterized protein YggU (UPF0235/DUF167 family)